MSVVSREHARTVAEDAARRQDGRWVAPVAVGAAAMVVAVLFAWVPSIWFDEAATVVSATRSWHALFREIGTVDLVHAAYYSVMHVWFGVVGYTPFTLRLPSAIAVGLTAGLTTVLARLLVNGRVGVLAGIFFALLPRTTWMGAEGRSYALGTLLAVASTLLFVVADRRTRAAQRAWPWWISYGTVSILGGAVFVYLALVILGHGLTVTLSLRRQDPGSRRAAWNWAGTTTVILLCLLPLAKAEAAQTAQVSWIPPIGSRTIQDVFLTQWSPGNMGFAVFLWVLVVGGLLLAWRTDRGRALGRVAVPWMVIPPLALIVVSTLTHPIYSPRYVSFSAPAIALCMAIGAARIPARIARRFLATAVIVAALLSAPSWVQQRAVAAKDDSDWGEVAALIQQQRALEPAGQKDAIVYGPLKRHPAATSRIIAESYPDAFTGIEDPLLLTPATQSDGLWETQRPLADIATSTGNARSVWLVTSVTSDAPATVTDALARAGYHPDGSWLRTRSLILRFSR